MSAVRKFGLGTILLFSFQFASATSLPTKFQFEGQLLDAGGNPIAGPVSLQLEIKNPASTCTLYKETHTSVAVDPVNGNFAVMVGDGTRGVDGGAQWAKVFNNSSAVDACYTSPAAGDGRLMHVTVGAVTLSPPFEITSVPMANVAGMAAAVDGAVKVPYSQSLLLVDGGGTNTVELKAPSSLASSIIFQLPNGLGTSGHVLTTDGTGILNWAPPAGGGGGTVTSVGVSAPLTVSTPTTTPAISIYQAGVTTDGYLSSTDWNVFNSKMASSLASGKIFVGSAGNTATAVTVNGDASLNNTGTLNISAGAVTTGKLAPATVTYDRIQNVSSSNRILGRSSVGAGTIEEITVGTGLSLTGGVLSASGGGGDFLADGSIAMTGPLKLDNGSFTTPALTFASALGTGISSDGGGSFTISTAGNERMVVGANNSNPVMYLKSHFGQTAPVVEIQDNMGTSLLQVNNFGNVGIGIAGPTELLHVGGNAKVDGNLTVAGEFRLAAGAKEVKNIRVEASATTGFSTSPLLHNNSRMVLMNYIGAPITVQCIEQGIPGQMLKVVKALGSNNLTFINNGACSGSGRPVRIDLWGTNIGPFPKVHVDMIYLSAAEGVPADGWYLLEYD